MDITIALIFVFVLLIFGLLFVYFWGIKPVIFKNITVNQIHQFLRILLYRGYTERKKTPNGRLHIYLESDYRYFILKKYKLMGNKIGLYLFIPVIDKKVKYEIKKILEKDSGNKFYWYEILREIDKEVIGVDISIDISWGIEFIRSIIEHAFNKNPNSIQFNVYFKNVSDDMTKFEDFNEDFLYLRNAYGNLSLAVRRATKIAFSLGRLTGMISRFFNLKQ